MNATTSAASHAVHLHLSLSAAIVLVVLAHLWGDFIAQTDQQAADKSASWRAMAGHLATYHALMGAAALAIWGLSRPALVLVAVSAATHAVIDRRWPVAALLRTTGSPDFADWDIGRLIVDQVLHLTVLLLTVLALTGQLTGH